VGAGARPANLAGARCLGGQRADEGPDAGSQWGVEERQLHLRRRIYIYIYINEYMYKEI